MAEKTSASETDYVEALKRIEAYRKSIQKSLNLSGLHLSTLPPEIGQLTALTRVTQTPLWASGLCHNMR